MIAQTNPDGSHRRKGVRQPFTPLPADIHLDANAFSVAVRAAGAQGVGWVISSLEDAIKAYLMSLSERNDDPVAWAVVGFHGKVVRILATREDAEKEAAKDVDRSAAPLFLPAPLVPAAGLNATWRGFADSSKSRASAMPIEPGFYWARQIAIDPGTRDEDAFEPAPKFEPVDVFENHYDDTAPDRLRVLVPGIEKSQSLGNFEWGAPIPAPAQP